MRCRPQARLILRRGITDRFNDGTLIGLSCNPQQIVVPRKKPSEVLDRIEKAVMFIDYKILLGGSSLNRVRALGVVTRLTNPGGFHVDPSFIWHIVVMFNRFLL